MKFERYFTKKGIHPFEEVNWREVTSQINDKNGNVIFKKDNVEFPNFWEQNAIDVTVEKYFIEKETSLRQFINRLVFWYTEKGWEDNYFDSEDDSVIFREELTYLLLHQYAAFNTPVNLNVGIQEPPQVSACFILSAEDTMDSISENMNTEMNIFRKGSGAGSNRSNLRSSRENVSTGGKAMGPIVASQIYDKIANATKSGGKSRRAAKMEVLDIDHGDIVNFITQKAEVERAAKVLIENGWNSDFDDSKGVYKLLGLQNFNESVSVTDAFMKAVEKDEDWALLERRDEMRNSGITEKKDTNQGEFLKDEEGIWYLRKIIEDENDKDFEILDYYKVIEWVKARDLWALICKSAWECADPGIQFFDNINKCHTCKSDGDIESSNPCVCGEELILTPYGPKEAKQVVVEEFLEVLDGKGNHTQVSKWWNNGKKDITKIKLNSGIETKVSSDHKFILEDGSEKKASALSKNDVLSSLPTFNFLDLPLSFYTKKIPNFRYRYQELEYDNLPKEWTEELAYFIGYLTGDGYIQDYRNNSGWVHRVHVTIGKCHPKVIKDILLKYSTGRLQELNKTKHSVEYQVSTTPFVKFLKNLGVTDTKQEKRIPYSIWTAPENIKFAFLSGLYDADGTKSFGKKNTTASFCIGNRYKFASEVWILLKSLKIFSRIRSQKATIVFNLKKKGNKSKKYVYEDYVSYKVNCPQADVWLMPKMHLCKAFDNVTYKRQRPIKKIKNDENRIINIEKSKDKEEVFDITVPTDYKFLTPAGVNVDCSEYLFLNDTSCNLASLNLLKFLKEDDSFDIKGYINAIRILITAMDISVYNALYPTEKIREKTLRYRTLGLGCTNVGALLLNKLLPYDSDEGRDYIAALTALLISTSYKTSSELASELGPFERYEENKESVSNVLKMHLSEMQQLYNNLEEDNPETCFILETAIANFPSKDDFIRNAQTVVIAPTGTISFMMGCETTGIEPILGLTTYKKMVGGGFKKLTIPSIIPVLTKLDYNAQEIYEITNKFENNGYYMTNSLKKEHLHLFATSFGTKNILSPEAHFKMLAAVQPFISGGISKTINLPNNATVEDIDKIYTEAWKLGLKSVSVYRDNCKGSQPLNLKKDEDKLLQDSPKLDSEFLKKSLRKKLPKDRPGHHHEFQIGTQKGFLQFGFYPDTGELGEMFAEISKGGSTINGLMNTVAILVSHMLQYGIPVEEIIETFRELKFEPNGITQNPDIKFTSSIPDYIGKYIELLVNHQKNRQKDIIEVKLNENVEKNDLIKEEDIIQDLSGPPCNVCGNLMIRSGTCYYCSNCGQSSGCS